MVCGKRNLPETLKRGDIRGSMSDQPYLVSARKYRPQDWESVVGQAGITQTLQQSIASGQIAQAYLFCGPRGVGKTTSARIFARAINGFDSADDALAFNVFELDAASNNKVEDIRSIVEQVRIPPQKGKYKVYIIDEVHMLSQAAFNAFLKTLEEPPSHAVFILATTEKHKILPTILSRCQIFDFHRITVPDTVAHLQRIAAQEGVVAEEQALHTIASKADGALRDALSMFDQLVAFAGKNLTAQAVAEQLHVLDHDTYFALTDCALSSDIPGALLQFDDVMARGFDAHHFVSGWASHMRNLMVCRDAQTLKLLEVTDEVKVQFQEQAARADLFFIVGALDVLNRTDVQFRGSQHQRLLVELALMQVCSQEALKKKSPDTGLMPPSKAPTAQTQGESAKSTDPTVAPPAKTLVAPPAQTLVAPPAQTLGGTPDGVPLEVLPEQPSASATSRTGGLRKSKRAIVTPGGAIKASIEAENHEGEGAEVAVDPSWKDEVTEEGVCGVWDAFVAKLRQDDKVALATTMAAHRPVLDGLEVRFDVANLLQREQMDALRTEVLTALKTELRNASLSLQIVVAEQSAESRKAFLSDRERYEMMVEKNPALDSLRKALDLDLG